jgi:diguanylate cyclase (GGDEF)-like protein/PAS domain S-box-containing protein
MKAPLPENEAARLEALYRYEILDTPPEEAFDEITRLASRICEAPIALITFVDADREWYKSKVGLTATEIPRSISFCAHVILEPNNVCVVPNTLVDERFKTNPLVTSELKIRFYAGAPLVTPEGYAIGVLCVMDYVPRELSAWQKEALRTLSRQVMTQIELRRNLVEMSRIIAECKRTEEVLRYSEEQYRALYEENPSMCFTVDIEGKVLYVNQLGAEQLGYTPQELSGQSVLNVFFPDDQKAVLEQLSACLENPGRVFRWEFRKVRKDGSVLWVREDARAIRKADGSTIILIVCWDITERKRAEDAFRETLARLSKKNRYEAIISAVARSVHQSITLQDVLENAVEALKQNIGTVDYVGIYLVEGEEAVLKAYTTNIPDWYIRRAGRIPYSKGLTWNVIMEGEPKYCADVDQDTVIGPAGREMGIKSYLSMPIHCEGQTVGTLNIASLEKNAFDEEELKLLEIVAQQIEIAFDNARRTEALQKAKEELELRVKERTEELSNANKELKREVLERKRAEEELQKANEELTRWIYELEERNRKMILLNEMGDLLQANLTADEIYDIITKFAQQLFPDDSGALYIPDASHNLLEAVALWGSSLPGELEFIEDKCWALRRWRVHVVENPASEVLCKHLKFPVSSSYLCVPIMAQGRTLGLLHLQSGTHHSLNEPEKMWGQLKESAKQQLVMTMAEHISLALANLKLRETLRDQAIHDPLTGLYNRRYMEETLQRELSRALRKRTSLGIIMLDVDNFKYLNDTFGHAAGDAFLYELGAFLQANIRREDIACRYGGEEFLLILPEASLNDTLSRAEELRERLKHMIVHYRGQPLSQVTVSLGVAVFPDHGKTLDSLLHSADAALYRAKVEGRDRVVIGEIINR